MKAEGTVTLTEAEVQEALADYVRKKLSVCKVLNVTAIKWGLEALGGAIVNVEYTAPEPKRSILDLKRSTLRQVIEEEDEEENQEDE